MFSDSVPVKSLAQLRTFKFVMKSTSEAIGGWKGARKSIKALPEHCKQLENLKLECSNWPELVTLMP